MQLSYQREGHAVVWSGTVFGDGGAMLLCWVAFVGEPVVLGIFLGETVHVVVTVGLGEDGGGGDGEVFAVAFYDGVERQGNASKSSTVGHGVNAEHGGVGDAVGVGVVETWIVRVEAVAVDDKGFWFDGELVDGAVHGEIGGMEDVDFVYLLSSADAYRPCKGIALYLFAEHVSLLLRQLLGVIEHVVVVVVWQDYGSGEDGTCEAAATCFIATSLYDIFWIVFILEHLFWGGNRINV